MSEAVPKPPRKAAAVILLRPAAIAPGLEVFLVRRHRKASFMSSAFVFPGGAADPGEDDLREAGARELFEEAGVRIENADALSYFSRWITPSFERKRFDATFYVAALPPDQTAAADGQETTDGLWVTPEEALGRSRELRLPPPQVRTMWELREPAARGFDAVRALCEKRAATPHPILPRIMPGATALTLLLPWDPEYQTSGDGDAHPIAPDHPIADGPSRFVLDDLTWHHR